MNVLKSQLNVLREIALRRPHAHLAFLFHAPYRAMYDNEGQNVELCERNGEWVYLAQSDFCNEKIIHVLKHNKRVYHPKYAIIAPIEHNLMFVKRGFCFTFDNEIYTYNIWFSEGKREIYRATPYFNDTAVYNYWFEKYNYFKGVSRKPLK